MKRKDKKTAIVLTPEMKKQIRKKALKKALNNWQLYLMILPALLYIILFAYKPMYGIQIAFRNFTFKGGITGSEWVGFDQFRRLFSSYWFPIILKNTLTISILNMVVNFPLPIVFALLVNEVRNEKVKRTIQTVSYAPHFISMVVLCGMFIMFLSPSYGIVNIIIEKFGGEAVAFMSKPELFKWIYVLIGVWASTGWSAIIYFSALSGVDQALLEAAEIDGASRLQRIWYINLPTIVPTIVIQLILQCGRVMSLGQEKTLLLQNNMNVNASEIISTYVYKAGLQQFQYSFSTAAGLFNSVVNCILLITVNKISKKLTEESLW